MEKTVQPTSSLISKLSGQVDRFGAKLVINPSSISIPADIPLVVDVETNEKDFFVGIGLTWDGETIYYFSDKDILPEIANNPLIGHNIKYDLHQLKNWGVDVTSEHIHSDTMLMSYVLNTTAMTHGLKPLAKQHLDMEWPTYAEMVETGTEKFREFKDGAGDRLLQYIDKLTLPRVKKAITAGCGIDLMNLWAVYKLDRCTLDYHPVEQVANYCGSDVLATWRLYQKFNNIMSEECARIYDTIELPTLRVLYDMEIAGIEIDLDKLKELHVTFGGKVQELHDKIQGLAGCSVNPNSSKQLAPILEKQGIKLPVTPKGNKSVSKTALVQYKDKPLVKAVLDHSEVEKLYSTYLDGFLKLPGLPRIHSTFNQIRYNKKEEEWEGMATNRLSSNNPNMQNIPKRGQYADLIRSLFIPKRGYTFIVGDYSQIEYRILAHMSQDYTLSGAFKNGKDLHEEVAKAIGSSREPAKQINYATIYGAQACKIAQLINNSVKEEKDKITTEEAETLLKKHEERFPKVYYWKNKTLKEARESGGVYTYLRRFIPIPGLRSNDYRDRLQAERRAINYIIQGSAAEVIKLAMIKCTEAGYKPILQVHDELIFEIETSRVEHDISVIKYIMEDVVKLDVPLNVDIHSGRNWHEAKS